MAVSTLKDTALYNIVQHVWCNSGLQDLELKGALRSCNLSNNRKTMNIDKKIENLTKTLCNQLHAITNVPRLLKAYLATALSHITDEINCFLDEAMENMIAITKVKLQILVKRIKLTPKGFIDKKSCLLRIIEDSQFAVSFRKEILLKNGIGKEELEKISKSILNHENIQRRKLIKRKQMSAMLKYPSLADYFDDLDDFNEDTPRKYYGLTVMERLICESSYDLLPYYLAAIEPLKRKREVEIAAGFVFDHMRILCPEALMFIYENIQEDTWKGYLKKYFEKIVAAFLDSWRLMPMNVYWFEMVIKDADKDLFLSGFFNIINQLKNNENENAIVCEIIKKIWMNTPKAITNDKEVMDLVISTLIGHKTPEYDLLECILRSYGTEFQKDFIIRTMFCTLTNPDTSNLYGMTRVIANLGFDKDKLKENLTHDVVKSMLMEEYCLSKNKAKDFDKILDFFGSKEEATNFKDSIRMDDEYVKKLLDKNWFEKNLKEFIIWLNHNSEEKYKEFISNLVSKGAIEAVYEKVIMDSGEFDHITDTDLSNPFSVIRVMMNGHIAMADEGLDNLNLSKSERETIKAVVLSKPAVRKHILICYFRCESMYDIAKEWSLFYNDLESGKKFFKEMFESEEGKAAILDMVLYCRKMHKFYLYDEQIQYYTKLRTKFFDQYELNLVADKVLGEHGHPNAKGDPILFEGREPKNEEEMFIGKTIVDFKYRTLRAVLNSPNPVIRYNKKMVRFFGDLSITLARRVGLNIPEVK